MLLLVSYLEVSAEAQVQLLSPEPKLVAAAQPGACILPASLLLLPPHPLIHIFSPQSCVEPHIRPPPQHTPTPACLHCPSPRCASRKLPKLQPLEGCRGEGEKGLLPASEPESRPPSTVECFVHCTMLLVSGVGRR